MRRIIVVLIGILFATSYKGVQAQDVSAVVFTNVQYLANDSVDVGWSRVLPTVRFDSIAFSGEFEFAQADNNTRMEWLSQLRVIYSVDSLTKVYVGRNFKSYGAILFAPVAIKTAKYPPYFPFKGLYGYGIRVDRRQMLPKIGVWNITADVSARPEGFREFRGNKPDVSLGATHTDGKKSYGFSGEYTGSYQRVGAFGSVSDSEYVSLTAVLFASTDTPKRFSGVVYLNGGRFSIFEPHLQYYTATNGESRVTFGVAAITKIAGAEMKAIADRVGKDVLFRTQAKVQL